MSTQTCNYCNETKKMYKFYSDGVCKKCLAEKKDEIKIKEKYCTKCKIIKSIDNFYKNSIYMDNYFNICIDCTKESKNKKTYNLTEFTDDIYSQFINEYIIKTSNKNDYITATTLYKIFKKFCNGKFKYIYTQIKFCEDISDEKHLGTYTNKKWVGYKIKNI